MSEATSAPAEEEVKTEEKEIKFFNIHEGLRGRDGGPYLDQAEIEAAEIRRAKVEDREPDFDNPGAVAGVPLVTIGQVPDNVYANPSMDQVDEIQLAVEKATEESALSASPQTLTVVVASPVSGTTDTEVPKDETNTSTPKNTGSDKTASATTTKKTAASESSSSSSS